MGTKQLHPILKGKIPTYIPSLRRAAKNHLVSLYPGCVKGDFSVHLFRAKYSGMSLFFNVLKCKDAFMRPILINLKGVWEATFQSWAVRSSGSL